MLFDFEAAEVVDSFPYENAAPGGGSEVRMLPLLRVVTRGVVPRQLDGLVLTSDLQGIAPVPSKEGATGLLAEALVERLFRLSEDGVVPDSLAMGALLAGDLYSDPRARKRGATGDVGPAWRAFADTFAWVAGVAGNHDLFSSRDARHAIRSRHVALLDGDVATFDGLNIGGVGGIIGREGKVNRKTPAAYEDALQRVLCEAPEFVVVHGGPPGIHDHQRGQAELLPSLQANPPRLLVSGHVHWPGQWWSRSGKFVHINVDGRAVLLVEDGRDG